MNDHQLPADLQQLERDLAARRMPQTPPFLRQRVLAEVQSRLQAQRRRDFWQYVAAAAAVVLVWMNLSLSATQATDFGFRRATTGWSAESVETTAKQIRELLPDLPPEESRRQAILLQAGSNLICLPDLSRSGSLPGSDPFFGE